MSFRREELVKSVMELFWEHGYESLSFNQIATATNLTRASLYNAFKTKEALFLECMNYYNETSPLTLLDDYRPGDSVGPLLFKILDQVSEVRANDKSNRGCLAVNAFNELAASESKLGALVLKAQAKKSARMAKLIRQAVKQNELPGDTDAEITAQIILAFMSGLNGRSKSGASRGNLTTMSQVFLQRMGFERDA